MNQHTSSTIGTIQLPSKPVTTYPALTVILLFASERGEHRFELEAGFCVFTLGVRIRHDATAREQGRPVAVQQRRTDCHGEFALAALVDPAYRSGVPTAIKALAFTDERQCRFARAPAHCRSGMQPLDHV